MTVKAVFFDVGETLISEDRLWRAWARDLGFSPDVFLAALDDVIRRGQDHRQDFERFRPDFDIEAARRDRAASGDPDIFDTRDLYPDALPCLRTLRARGFAIGIAGNQPAEAETALKQVGFEADIVASSTGWGVAKPSPAFFAKIAAAAGLPAAAIAYVGDRLDNDVIPARDAGMLAIFLMRGPWARHPARRPDIARADMVLHDLDGLADTLT